MATVEAENDSSRGQAPQPAAASPRSLVGTVLSERYRIERLIGEGGMGAVYLAEHLHMHKRLALKVLHPEMSRLPEIVARFEREAMAAGHIDHPNVATASDFGQLPDGSFFLVLEYVEGRNLRDVLHGGALGLGRALHIAHQIAEGLARAHALGIVHRDLKPENVMILERDGDPDFVKVLDFGIAKVPMGSHEANPSAPRQALTQIGAVFGTPDYMAPEQALGQAVDGRADLYSLGVLLFEMLTGVVPFEHENAAMVLGMQVSAPPPSIASKASDAIPAEVEAIVARLLAKDAAQRFADARQLSAAIQATMIHLSDEGRIAVPHDVLSMTPRSQRGSPDATSIPRMPVARFVASLETGGQRAFVASRQILGRTTKTTWLVMGGALGTLCLLLALTLVLVGAKHPANAASSAAPAQDDVVPAHPREPSHGDLERAAMASGDVKGALAEAREWLEADPRAAGNPRLAIDLRTLAMGHESPESAEALLETMGAVGIDVLYDLAYGYGFGPNTARARKALTVPAIAARASPSLAATLELRSARTCDKKKALFDRAREVGDERTLAVLREYQGTSGCGFLKLRDCWGCMHQDDSLASTVAAIKERARRD